MKTLHLTNSWHETSGGIATFYRALIQQANRRQHEIRLVVPAARDWVEEVGEFGKIYHVQAPPALLNRQYRMIYPTQFLTEKSKLQRILAAERPDVVEICDKYTLNYLGILLRRGLLSGVDYRPIVVGLSCERIDDNFRSYIGRIPFAGKFCSTYMKWLYFPFFDYHIANSRYTAAELQASAQGQIVERGTWVLPMGADLSDLSPQLRSHGTRQRLLKEIGAEDGNLLLYVGRLVPEKNLGLLFDLMIALAQEEKSNYRLLVVGDGIERKHWQQLCDEKISGRVSFLGHVKNRKILAGLYANADAFVHPNPHEPFGIAPLEAMASGIPLIAPNQGGVTSYANPENAWTVEPCVSNFATAVKEAIANPELRAVKVGKALNTVQEYRWENVTSSFLDLYSELQYAARTPLKSLPDASFYSTSPSWSKAMLFRGISQTAEAMFRVYSHRR